MRFLFLFVLFAFISLASIAQETDSTSVTEEIVVEEPVEVTEGDQVVEETVAPKDLGTLPRYQEEPIDKRKFDQNKWKEIVGDETFAEKAVEEKARKEKKKEAVKNSGMNFPSINPAILQGASYIIIFALVVLILFIVIKNTRFKESIRKSKITPVDATAPIENIEELEADDLLREALASGNLRLAVRIQYLRLLKKLNEVGLIRWKKDKTNRDYLTELYDKELYYEGVRRLTLAYEIVWYGERSVSTDSFQKLSSEFESVNSQILQFKPTGE